MPKLADTVAAIARRRRRVAPAGGADSGRLKPVAGFGSNPGRLRMLAYAPADLQPGAPLVVVLHGCSQTAAGYAEGAGWVALAEREGFVVLAPEQTSGNNPNLCFNWFEPDHVARDRGEAASIRQMVARAVADHGCDPSRVFVTGLSAGGAMTAAMLAAYPEVFAAGAVVAGLPYGAATNVQEAFAAMFQGRIRPAREWGDGVRAASSHAGPWPRLSIWHGDADATVKPGAADELARQWTNLHAVAAGPTVARSASGRAYEVWRDAAGREVVELHRLPGMGHGTPLAAAEGLGAAGPYLLEVGVSSTLEIARFWGISDGAAVAADAPVSASAPLAVTMLTEVQTVPAPEPALASFELPRVVGLRSTARGHSVDVSHAITSALRSAGLMK